MWEEEMRERVGKEKEVATLKRNTGKEIQVTNCDKADLLHSGEGTFGPLESNMTQRLPNNKCIQTKYCPNEF